MDITRKNIAISQAPVGRLELELDMVRTQRMALLAMPYVNKRSFYYGWIVEFLEKEGRIPLWKYAKLKARLVRAQGEAV